MWQGCSYDRAVLTRPCEQPLIDVDADWPGAVSGDSLHDPPVATTDIQDEIVPSRLEQLDDEWGDHLVVCRV